MKTYNRKNLIFRLHAQVEDLEWVIKMIMSDYPLDEILDKLMKRKRAYEKQASLERREWREKLLQAANDLRQKNKSLHLNN